MGNIYCLMGKSASGKDTIYNRLLAMERLHLRRVVPYTTRPMRSGETDGQTYVFCTEPREKSLNCVHTIRCMAYGNILPRMMDRSAWRRAII